VNSGRLEILRLRPTWSRYLFYWLLASHAVGVIAIFMIQSLLLVKMVLLSFLALLFISAIRRHLLWRGRYAVREAWVGEDEAWHLLLGNGETLQTRLLSDSFVKPWLMVLRFKSGRFTPARSMVLFPDSLEKTVSRKLRIYLLRLDSRGF
jgi:hypothetical protein